MHRIDTISAQKDKFGSGKNGFTTGDPQSGTPATEVSAEILDALQEEICAVIEDVDSGLLLSKSENNQLISAVKNIVSANTVPKIDAAKSAAIKDAHRHAVESASGGRNTVLYDAQGNANIMVILPRLRYEDLGMTASERCCGI